MNESTLRRFFCTALVGAVLFGAVSSFANPDQLAITTDATLPVAKTDVSYWQPVEASGGLEPYTWTIVNRDEWPNWLDTDYIDHWNDWYGLPYLSGWPHEDDIGTNTFSLCVTDAEGTSVTNTFTLIVERNPNHRPEIVSRTPADYIFTVATGETVRLTVTASDPDGDPLTYEWWGRDPNGNWFSSMGDESFEFMADTNGFHTVNVNVDDGMFSCDTVSWWIWAGDVEPLEIITETNLPVVTEGVPYSVCLEAIGGAGGYRWGLGELPNGLSVYSYDYYSVNDVCVIDAQENTEGTYSFDISVTDALGNIATKTFTLVVADNPNRAPWIESKFPSRGSVRIAPGESAAFTVVVTDPDEQPISFEWTLERWTDKEWGYWEALATNMTIGSESTFVLPPLEESEEEYHLFCNVIDGPWTNYVSWSVFVRAPLAIVNDMLPDTTEMADYEVRLMATNAMGSVRWSIDENPYAVHHEPNSFAVSGGKILGARPDDDDFDTGGDASWIEIELPFDFPFEGLSYSSVTVSLGGSLGFQYNKQESNNATSYSVFSICPCEFFPDRNHTEVFLDDSMDGQVTFTWCGEGTSTWSNGDSDGENVSFHFSATLYEDGSVRFSYGDGNLDSPQYRDVQIGNQWLYDCFHDGMSQVDDVVLLPRSVPPGLTVTADGILSGRPTQAGSYVFDVQADDGWQTTNRTFSLVVKENENKSVVVDSFVPMDGHIDSDHFWSTRIGASLFLGESRTYSVVAHDPEGMVLSYEWSVDGTVVPGETGTSFTYVVSEADMAFDEYGNPERERRVKCSISDGLWTREIEWKIRFARTWYVDATSTADDPDGLSWESAFPSLVVLENAWSPSSGDLVLVAPGVYSSKRIQTYLRQTEDGNDWIEVEETVPISLSGLKMRSTGGPFQTVIDGEGEVSLPSECSGFTGFTLRNGAPDRFASSLYDRSFDHCIVSNCTFVYGGFTSCTFENCAIAGNTAENGPLFSSCRLFNCTIVDNRSPASGDYATLDRHCEAYNSIVWNNQDKDGAIRNYEHGSDFSTRFENCCLNEFHDWKPGLVFGNPMLAGSGNGDVRLREGSSCIDAGLADWIRGDTDIAGRPRMQGSAPDIGAWEGVTATGHVVSVCIQGHGTVFPTSILVPDGGSATFAAEETMRPFRGFFDEDGNLLSSESAWTAEDVRGDRTVVAAFETRTFHADAATGNDANDGRSWEKPKKTIQAAVDAAFAGERILVASGTYEPFRTDGKRIRIEGVDGAERTIVDGGETNRCATLGQLEWNRGNESTIVGFTLRNGFAKQKEMMSTVIDDEYYSNLYSGCGGGAYGGTLIDCIVQSNHADESGGGLYGSSAIRCLVFDNEVGQTGERVKSGGVLAYGGGAAHSMLVNCLVSRNTAWAVLNDDRATGGGVAGGSVYNCTIVDNRLSGLGKCRGAGVSSGTFYGCIIAQNDFDGNSGETFSGSGLESELSLFSTFVGGDPKFVNAAKGDYRLLEGSPCIDAGWLSGNAEWDVFDLVGNPRVVGAAVDMGCYEGAVTTYTVKFSANGGKGAMAAQTISRDKSTNLTANKFTRGGYVFLGWAKTKTGAVAYKNGAAVKNLAAAGGSVTLYAKWAVAKYKVAFNACGGTLPKGKSMAAQTMAYGKAAALRKNVFTRKGYVFAGWAVKKGGPIAYKNGKTVKNLRTDGKTTTLFALWAKPKYQVAFDPNGGKGTMSVQTFKYGKTANLAACKFTAPKGKKFAGWATSAANAKAGKVKFKNKQAVKNLLLNGKTVKLYAVWIKKK